MLGLMHPLIYFPLYEKSKLYFKRNWDTDNKSDTLSTKYIMLSATTCKGITSVLTYPHEVIRSRMQDARLQDEESKLNRKLLKGKRLAIITTINAIRKEGYTVFYSGFWTNLIRLMPSYAITFVLYETLSVHFHNLID